MNKLAATALAILAAIATLLGLKVRGDRWREKARLHRDIAETNAKAATIREEQLRDAAQRPATKSDLIERIKRNGL